MPKLRNKKHATTLDALRLEAAMVFSVLPKPAFTYGLNVFFPASAIPTPDDVGAAASPVAVHAPDGVEVRPLSEALADPEIGALVRERLASGAGDRIDAWLQASVAEGTFIRLPAGRVFDAPIRLDLRMDGDRRADLVFVLAEEGSAATFVEHLSSAPMTQTPARRVSRTKAAVAPRLRASRTEIVARAGAKVTHVAVQDFGPDVTAFDRKGARVEANASVFWMECAFGSGYLRSRIATELVAEGAHARLLGLAFASDSQKFDQRHEVRHLAPRTTSDVATRVAVGGTAKAVYRSLVKIAPNAAGCDGAQREDTLLLAPRAEVDAMPDLEIGTGDVRARHSASAGRLDAEQLFFLESRGLPHPVAVRLLIEGFFAPVVDAMRESGLADQVDCLIAGKLDRAATFSGANAAASAAAHAVKAA